MRFNKLDLNLLVALDALMAEGKITEAAHRLNLSQSAMSSALGRLRDYFNDQLLVQVGQRMVPTPLAMELEQPVREALLHIQTRIARRAGFDPASDSRTVAVGASDYFMHVVGADLLRTFETTAPRLRLEFWPVGRAATGKLNRGELDVLFVERRYLADDKPFADLFEDEFVAVVCVGNDSVGDRVDAAAFQSLGHVACRFGPDRAPGVEQDWIAAAGLDRRCEVTIENFSMLLPLIVGTQRVAVVQRRLAERFARQQPIRIASLPFEAGIVESMQWQAFNSADPFHKWFRESVKAVVREQARQTVDA